MPKTRFLNVASSGTILITLVLFTIALFKHGLTEKLLLESGVFLVSVKLVLTSTKAEIANEQVLDRLAKLELLLQAPSRTQRTDPPTA